MAERIGHARLLLPHRLLRRVELRHAPAGQIGDHHHAFGHAVTTALRGKSCSAPGSRQAAAGRARATSVIELLRETRNSRGVAARLLGLTPWRMLDLIAERMPIASRLLVLMVGIHSSVLACRNTALQWRRAGSAAEAETFSCRYDVAS